jgi:hypothetical protein
VVASRTPAAGAEQRGTKAASMAVVAATGTYACVMSIFVFIFVLMKYVMVILVEIVVIMRCIL